VMKPLRTSQRSTFERWTGASPYFSRRRLRKASASSPRTRTSNHCCGADISHSTFRPLASPDRAFQTGLGPRLRTVSGIFSARVAVCQPSAKTVLLLLRTLRQRKTLDYRIDLIRACTIDPYAYVW